MDEGVAQLLAGLDALPVGQNLDFPYWREQFIEVLKRDIDEKTRGVVLNLYSSFLDNFERGLIDQGRDPEPFRNARKADWRTICITEALLRSDTDLFHPSDLSEIIEREIAAGRMTDESFSDFAFQGAKKLDEAEAPVANRKRGFFRRLFG